LRLGALTTALALVASVATLAQSVAPVAADPITDADATVQSLRQEADRAAQQYFDALGRAAELDATIVRLESQLPDLVARRRTLRVRAEERAVAAYMRAGVQLGVLFDSGDALTTARRRQLLERLNERDNDAFDDLAQVTRQLQGQRRELRAARTEQEATVATLTEQGRDIDAKLQAAVDRRNQLQAEAATRATPPTASDAGGGTGGAPAGGEVPTALPPGYVPTPGTHPNHDDPFLVCTRGIESGGNYGAVNPAGPYLGAYQFLQSTWNGGANHAGRVDLIGVPPNTASAYDQDDVAWTVYQWRGKGPWGGRC
jgi:hypothetical protein